MDKEILLRIKRKYTLDWPYIKDCQAYDDMANMVWAGVPGLADKDWAVKFVSPLAHDAEKTACNIFDTFNPKFDILPRGPDDKDYAEELERFLEWQMMKANAHGEEEPNRAMMKSSVRYNRVTAELEYLPDDESGAPFCIINHDPRTIRKEVGKYGLRWVAVTNVLQAGEIADNWEVYADNSKAGKKIATALETLSGWLEKNEKLYVAYVDYKTKDKRYVCFWKSDFEYLHEGLFNIFDKNGKTSTDVVEIYDGPNDLGFINWAISTGTSDPLFYALHHGDLWVNANRTETIKRSSLFRRAFWPLGIVGGAGQDVQTDYTGDIDVLNVPAGRTFTPVPAPQLDPGWEQLSGEDNAVMAASTGIQNLRTITPASNVQYATVNAWIELAMTDLEPYKRTTEKGLEILGHLMFKFIKVKKLKPTSYRTTSKTDGKIRGENITIGPDDFDEAALHIQCDLIANTPTDKMQLTNMAMQLKQAQFPIPDAEALERLGYGNPDALIARWEEQQLSRAALAATIQKLTTPPPQPPNQPAPTGNTAPVIPQGMNPAEGAPSPMQAAPQMTQTVTRP